MSKEKTYIADGLVKSGTWVRLAEFKANEENINNIHEIIAIVYRENKSGYIRFSDTFVNVLEFAAIQIREKK